MQKHAGSFDFILDCVSAPHDMDQLLGLLKLDATLCLVGLPEKPLLGHAVLPAGKTAVRPGRIGHRRHERDAGNARLFVLNIALRRRSR